MARGHLPRLTRSRGAPHALGVAPPDTRISTPNSLPPAPPIPSMPNAGTRIPPHRRHGRPALRLARPPQEPGPLDRRPPLARDRDRRQHRHLQSDGPPPLPFPARPRPALARPPALS